MFELVVLTAVQLASHGLINYTLDSDTDKEGGFTLRRLRWSGFVWLVSEANTYAIITTALTQDQSVQGRVKR